MFPFTAVGRVSVKKFRRTHKYMGKSPCCNDCGFPIRVILTKFFFFFQKCPNCGAFL